MGWGGSRMKLRKLDHGDTLTVRLTKDVPSELIEVINIIREEGGGNQRMYQILAKGLKEEMDATDERISIYIEGLSKEEKIRIESHKEMMSLIRAIIKAGLEKGY